VVLPVAQLVWLGPRERTAERARRSPDASRPAEG
jgi:hypothetical protein